MRAVLRAAVLLLAAAVVSGQQPAQQNMPRAGYVYPAGGQRGATFQVVVGGQFLDGVSAVIVSGRDVRASFVAHDKPLGQQQINAAREQVQALQAKVAEPGVREQLQTLRARIAESQQRNRNPALSERVTIEVTVAPDAAPGARQLRLGTPLGLSNPLVFEVGQLAEARERDVKNSRADAELTVTLPVTVNGRLIPGDVDNVRQPPRQPAQYMPGDVDRYRFQARKGAHLIVAVSARDLQPYLADAVPGWLQAVVTLYDSTGHEVACADDDRFRPDPVLHYLVPADGEYVAEIRDAIFRGREDFVYRASIGELPVITSLFPLGGPSGARTTVELTGWNLSANRMAVDADEGPGVTEISARNGPLESKPLPFAVDSLPEQLEREPNDTRKDAQPVTLPVIVNGRIRQTGDWDVYRFTGRAGAGIVAEVTARRLESPLDSVVELTDAAGRRIAFNDDYEDKGAGLVTHHADSFVMATLPADGTYFVRLGDIQRKGGLEYGYRLRISAPRPDFELRVTPSSVNAASGANVPIAVTAIRKDGFAGDIAIALGNRPGGFAVSGGLIPAGQDQIRVTVTAPPAATPEPIGVRLEGRAVIQGQTVVHPAVPADDRMQAFAYHHLVTADALRVSVSGRGGTRVPMRVLVPQPLKIQPGGSVRVRVALPPAYGTFEHIQFELSEPPKGLTLRDISVRGTEAAFVLQADASAVRVGLRGNLIVTVSGERVPPANAQAPATRRRVQLGFLPAVAFEIIRGSQTDTRRWGEGR